MKTKLHFLVLSCRRLVINVKLKQLEKTDTCIVNQKWDQVQKNLLMTFHLIIGLFLQIFLCFQY